MIECKLEWVDNFYPLKTMIALDWGCYSRKSFREGEKDGVAGAWVHEGVCPVHGVVCSMLGGIPIPSPNRQKGIGMNYDKSKYREQDTDARVFLNAFDGNPTIIPPDGPCGLRATQVLAVGQNEEDTANILTDAGFNVVGYDLRTPRLCEPPRYQHLQKDFVGKSHEDFPDESFDYAYSLSAIEHFGLPVYGGTVDPDYDSKAMDRIWDLLRWGGTCWITTPYCKHGHTFMPHWRVYDSVSLHPRIIRKFSVEEKAFFKSHPDCPGLPAYPEDQDGLQWVPQAVADEYWAGPEGTPPHLTCFLRLRKDR